MISITRIMICHPLAEKWEELSLPGVGNATQAGKLEQQLRWTKRGLGGTTRTMDIENLISREGDIVSVADDVMRLGGKPTWVSSFTSATGTTVITLDNPSPNMTGAGVRIRYFETSTNLPRLTDPLSIAIDPNGNGNNAEIRVTLPAGVTIKSQYMVLWGAIDRISKEYQIVSIKYSADMSATLDMLEYYPDPLNYDGSRVVVGETPTIGEVATPLNVKLETIEETVADGKMVRFAASWSAVPAASHYRVVFTDAVRGII